MRSRRTASSRVRWMRLGFGTPPARRRRFQASMNTPITTATAGLLARYGLNEGTGTAVGDSIAPAAERHDATGRERSLRGRPARQRLTATLRPPPPRPALPRRLARATSLSTGTTTARETSLATTSTGAPRARSARPARRLTAATPLVASQYDDPTGTPGTTYFYVVTAEDTSGNESGASNEVSDSPDPFSQAALQFDGANDHVTLGSAAGLECHELHAGGVDQEDRRRRHRFDRQPAGSPPSH